MKKERKPLSQSFVMGVIAMVFLIIGYQTALLVYRASVTRIVANRDEPDTVFIIKESVRREEAVAQNGGADRTTVRKNSDHSPLAEAVRKTAPRKHVESFRFNPNTVTKEDLCRLGFSDKQAQAICSYREKGGVFRRKEDFSKSFVVSDSVFRRLESYIDIPLIDLNTADSSTFDSLPGIGGWFASRMVEYRKVLHGYSYKEQLMDIYRFDAEKFDALADLITVSPENVVPYPLWNLPADSLRSHPYIGDHAAEGVVLFRENNPQSAWTVDNLEKAGILKAETAVKLKGCAILQP